ncbi:MAG: hypothetical protein H0U85_00135 [Gemmatimonadales bacterium]|nr:hypothetical protein [Gemmatimonadales bacterium]
MNAILRNGSLLLGLALAGAPLALQAQATAIMPAAPLDARRLEVRNSLLVLRDTLNSISIAAARLQRDFRSTSRSALTSRARMLAAACTRSQRTVPRARAVVAAMPYGTAAQRTHRDRLLREMDSVVATVTRCATDFGSMAAPGKGEEVRGYGNRRAEPLLAALLRYDEVVNGFFTVYDIEVRPLGAGKNPLAS